MRTLAGLLFLASLTSAQEASPYVGERNRAIKALSDQELTDLREGAGMGFAKAAELNGYPGPKHVLELAEKLELSADQRRRIREEFARMKAEARDLGEQVIAAEARLEEVFADGRASLPEVEHASAKTAELRGKLRATHLKAHIATTQLLTAKQSHRYQQLRGYAAGRQHH
jgi:Spy/CpxP family protein refolding chaperone